MTLDDGRVALVHLDVLVGVRLKVPQLWRRTRSHGYHPDTTQRAALEDREGDRALFYIRHNTELLWRTDRKSVV